MTHVGVLASGNGTTLQAILDASQVPKSIGARVAVVISNEPQAFALERARKTGVDAVVVNHRNFDTRERFEEKLIEELDSREVDLVCLAGFMRILTPLFVRHYQGRMMNIHPALLPLFGGKGFYGNKVHRAALESGMKFSGCTVHFVTEETDGGPIILQAAVPILDDDTAETLAGRIHKKEHEIYPEAVKLFAEGRLEVTGKRVRILVK
jgi:phosphoribosylglycinamide formyltransferase-1